MKQKIKRNLPVRVLQVGMTKNIGGMESYLMQQFRHLDRSKVLFDFVNITDEDEIVFADEIRRTGSKIYGVKSRHSNPIRHYWQWYRLLQKNAGNYDAIELNYNNLTYVFPLLIARWSGIPMRIMHSHNTGNEQKIGFLKRILIAMNRRLLKSSATNYLACSMDAGRWMFGKDTSFIVIHNAIETEDFLFNPEKRERIRSEMRMEGKFVIGHVARFSYQKNHLFLLDVFKKFHDSHPESVLWLIGGTAGNDRFLAQAQEKVRALGIADAVCFWGMRDDVSDLMQAMDCHVLPSLFEGLPIVSIESQTAGLPCVVSDAVPQEAQITDLLEFAPLGDVDTWCEKLERAMHVERRDMRQEIVDAGYDIKHEIGKLEKLYLERVNG